MTLGTRTATAIAALSAALLSCSLAFGDASPELFQRGAQALERGEFASAIDAFEALADSGYVSPDATFDRGLAYVMRVKEHAERPGDLGRAAAAFEETLRMRPDDRDADALLDQVRAEVTRRRARHAKDTVDVRPTLDRIIVELAPETTWSALALVASVLLSIGLVLRRRTGTAHVVGSVLLPASVIALLAFVPLSIAARHLRLTTRPGVVVAAEARWMADDGRPTAADPIPEAARVEVGERRAGMAHVRWGATEGWIPAASVRLLAPL